MSLSFCFCDGLLDYHAATPLEAPLGGTQSAVCYLAAALARRGHRVTLLTRLARQRSVLGVECMNISALADGLAQARVFDCFVFVSRIAEFAGMRPIFAPGALRILWTGDGADQPSTRCLQQPEIRRFYDRVVCASDWHRDAFTNGFKFAPEIVSVIRYAIGPRFENLFADVRDLVSAKSGDPRFVYTSTPYRGLSILLDLFPALHAARPQTSLDVYSGMTVYQLSAQQDRYAGLYARARSLQGVRYVGSVSQSELAAGLRAAALLTYPNTFAETGCIAVMEALAAGLHVVTSAHGALPETTMGFGDLIAKIGGRADLKRYAAEFCTKVLAAVDRRRRDPAGFAERCFDQVQALNRTTTWAVRAAEWEAQAMAWKASQNGVAARAG